MIHSQTFSARRGCSSQPRRCKFTVWPEYHVHPRLTHSKNLASCSPNSSRKAISFPSCAKMVGGYMKTRPPWSSDKSFSPSSISMTGGSYIAMSSRIIYWSHRSGMVEGLCWLISDVQDGSSSLRKGCTVLSGPVNTAHRMFAFDMVLS